MTVLVVMGVSGVGKTTIGVRLADALGWTYQEGDALHPPANVAKMAGGTPLTDADRWPWLRTIAAVIDRWREQGKSGVVTCSALKRAYRDVLLAGRPDVRLVYLRGDKGLIAARMAARTGHFMPPGLLDSQFAALEPPVAEENPITVDVEGDPDQIVAAVLATIKLSPVQAGIEVDSRSRGGGASGRNGEGCA